MTPEEKQLLMSDLCARLPYGVICEYTYTDGRKENFKFKGKHFDHLVECKPYLRPMESMTLEEHGQYMDFILWSYNDYDAKSTTCVNKERINKYKKFIYSHHLDDGDLIGKGLAEEAPEGMYDKEI